MRRSFSVVAKISRGVVRIDPPLGRGLIFRKQPKNGTNLQLSVAYSPELALILFTRTNTESLYI